MMCSIEELGSTREMYPEAPEYGIYIFPEDAVVGESASKALGLDDVVFEYEITSNRVDCYGVLGIAREAAATFNEKFCPPVVECKGNDEKASDYVKVTVEDPKLCPRYCARVVKNVKIGPSPKWMQRCLASNGIRPINNLIDYFFLIMFFLTIIHILTATIAVSYMITSTKNMLTHMVTHAVAVTTTVMSTNTLTHIVTNAVAVTTMATNMLMYTDITFLVILLTVIAKSAIRMRSTAMYAARAWLIAPAVCLMPIKLSVYIFCKTLAVLTVLPKWNIKSKSCRE